METLSPSKRSYPLPGNQASGAIVFASLFILLGLGVCGFLSLHAYVHRSDPPASLSEPIPPQVPRAESTTAPSALAAPVAAPMAAPIASIQAVPTVAASDNPYP
jgi:hypothetical protein